MIDSIAVARRRLMNQVLAQWPEDEVQALFRLTEDMGGGGGGGGGEWNGME